MLMRMIAVPFLLLISLGSALAEQPKILSIETVKVPADADRLQRLLVERFNTAVAELQMAKRMYDHGVVPFGNLVEPAIHVRDSGLELSDDPQEKIAHLKRFLEFAQLNEKTVQQRYETGTVTPDTVQSAKYLRLDTEIVLLRLERETEKSK